jgi:Zn-dependent protease with chaperone function
VTELGRFLAFNLLLSLAAGGLAWLIALGGMRLLDLRSSAQSLCFLGLPVLKSLLILLGVGLVFPWPAQLFGAWRRLALPFGQVWPFLLVWAVGAALITFLAVRRARADLLREARPAEGADPALAAVFQQEIQAYRQLSCPPCSDDVCCVVGELPAPRLLISDRLDSPLAITGRDPLVLFPAGLGSRLTEAEISGALAHELAHFILRRPTWCSAGTLQKLTLIDPPASLVEAYLHRQEEKACDDLAVAVVGQPEVYAGMLTQCYRFAREQRQSGLPGRLAGLPRLLGVKPLLSERVEHLLAPQPARSGWRQSPLAVWAMWILIFSVLFFNTYR